MSFGAAHRRLDAVSPALNSANYAVDAARNTERAVSTLDRPLVTVSAQYLEYQKTFAVDLTGRKQEAIGEARDFLSGLPSTLPPAFREIAADIVGRI
nr:TolC family protein [Brevundimonas sp.]